MAIVKNGYIICINYLVPLGFFITAIYCFESCVINKTNKTEQTHHLTAMNSNHGCTLMSIFEFNYNQTMPFK